MLLLSPGQEFSKLKILYNTAVALDFAAVS